ncbi:MAG: sugar phosphate isomerase/epimerase [Clostridia bacterium]|nr:sugar phosphate isomerase/epimerase [Clostridia bacterium]
MIRLCAFSDEAAPDLQGQIDALKRNGIGMTELRSVGGVNVSRLSKEDAENIKKELDGSGIKVWSVGSPYGKVSLSDGFSEDKLFETLHRLCGLANVFGCDKIRVFSFYDAYDKAEQVKELLGRSVMIAASYGVGLYHENEKDIYGDVPDRVLELYNDVPGLRLVYDPANYIQCGQSADKTLPALCGITSYYHIKDVIAETGELVPSGFGDGQIGKITELAGTDTVFTVEPHLAVFAGYSEIDRSQMKNRFNYESNGEAFDAAVNALKTVLAERGFVYENGGYVRK